jgi:hypothetical protein
MQYKSINFMNNPLNNKSGWMGQKNEALTGFPWRSGVVSETAGIVIWSDIFLYENGDEKTAIVLIDTQGTFDTGKKSQDTMTTVVLNSLFASSMIMYQNSQISEDVLNFLQVIQRSNTKLRCFISLNFYFLSYQQINTDYAKMIVSENKNKNALGKPFQNLLFLIRDWPNVDEYDYGLTGGNKYLAQTLDFDGIESNKNTRQNLKMACENINAFLLPYPGAIIATSKNQNGSWDAMNVIYKKHLESFIEWTFSPKNLVKKKFFGEFLNGKDYFNFLINYCESFRSQEHTDVSSFYKSTIENQLSIAVSQSLDYYRSEMAKAESSTSFDEKFETAMADKNEKTKKIAVEMFEKKEKIGSDKVQNEALIKLKNTIDSEYAAWKAQNANALKMIKTMKTQLEIEIKKGLEQIKHMKSVCDNDMSVLQGQINENTNTRNQLQEEIRKQQEKHNDEIDDLNAKLEKNNGICNSKIDTTTSTYEKKISKLNTDHAAQIKSSEADCKKRESAINVSMRDLKLKMKAQELQQSIHDKVKEREMNDLKRKNKNREDAIREEYSKEIERQRKVINDLEGRENDNRSGLNKQIVKLKAELETCGEKNDEYQDQLLDAKSDCNDELMAEKNKCKRKVQEAYDDCHRAYRNY